MNENNTVFVVVYSYHDDEYNESNYDVLGVYDSLEKAVDRMKQQAKSIEINNSLDDVLYFDNKSEAVHYIHYYNNDNNTNELVMIYIKGVE